MTALQLLLRRRRLPGTLTPPSVRFLSRRVFIAIVVVLIAIVREGITDGRLERLERVVRVDRRTIEGWRRWWRQTFTQSPFWRAARAAFMPPVDPDRLPAALIARFTGNAADRLVAPLRFLKPVTGGTGGRVR